MNLYFHVALFKYVRAEAEPGIWVYEFFILQEAVYWILQYKVFIEVVGW